VTDVPAWRFLHDAWWLDQRQPQPCDLEAAWDAMWEIVTPDAWSLARPERHHDKTWTLTAQWLRRLPGKDAVNVVSAFGPTLPVAIVELARCVSEVEQGRVPR
jgi:hypothetical protein